MEQFPGCETRYIFHHSAHNSEAVAHIGQIKEEYESLAYYDRVVFWSAPIATFSRTRVSKISKNKAMYHAITVRNANTALKLAEIAGETVK